MEEEHWQQQRNRLIKEGPENNQRLPFLTLPLFSQPPNLHIPVVRFFFYFYVEVNEEDFRGVGGAGLYLCKRKFHDDKLGDQMCVV